MGRFDIKNFFNLKVPHFLIYAIPLILILDILSTLSFLQYKEKVNLLEVASLSENATQNGNSIYDELTANELTPQDEENVKEVIIKSDDTIYEIFKTLKIPPPEIAEIIDASKKTFHLSKIRANHKIKITYDLGKVSNIQYEIDEDSILEIKRIEDKFVSDKIVYEYDREFVVKEGIIFTSLFDVAAEIDLPQRVIVNLANIFEYEIDFNKEIQRGDSFKILIEKFTSFDRPSKYGQILAAEFINRGELHEVYHYTNNTGENGYYDKDGNSIRRKFLRSPVKFSRISSTYTTRRFHPLLGINRPHRGVDYAAKHGTPIRSVASGVVVYAGYHGGHGNYIKIKHDSTYSTAYGHMSRFGKGMRRGARVKQGDIIGYVGSTGLSTGPHCHFEVYQSNHYINPLKLKFPTQEPISKKYLTDYKLKRDELANYLAGKVSIAAKTTP